ncbi:hypothetical protein RchiOBHm_Chr6g0257241 [Rosa chinensis]|uniref:Uncharacterized protein n=1 Tax=Rosa chinensis TaxID=74649 RepID=A0A2P6PMB1_ROSCH|nr:hypothetical protein RchiOBHm_Chr6g0257241 [Rosa chinensis]
MNFTILCLLFPVSWLTFALWLLRFSFLFNHTSCQKLTGFGVVAIPVHYSNCVVGNPAGQENQGGDRAG